jgi:protoporphyrinogen oxidase
VHKKKIVIIGAGPAGLTAAYELSRNSGYDIVVLESDKQVGGISRTVNYKDNLIDIGGHRFFSKSERVLEWWASFMPVVDTTHVHSEITYHNKKVDIEKLLWRSAQDAMLIRPRLSRIYFKQRMYDYPLKLNMNLVINLGKKRSLRIARDLMISWLKPINPEKNLEDFYINRFGRELYKMFFKDYTRKVWGKACTEISAEWGRQRVKSLKVPELIWHSLRKMIGFGRSTSKNTSRTLTEKFLYPAKGPGMLWEKVAERCTSEGVHIEMESRLTQIHVDGTRVTQVSYVHGQKTETIECDELFSTMPLQELSLALGSAVPKDVAEIFSGLEYRDFLIVGLKLTDLKFENENGKFISDNWIYIQDKGVNVGRMQIFNNWSPFMVAGQGYWIGAEYFCSHTDEIWNSDDEALIKLALQELEQIGVLDASNYIDGTVVRCPKAYPSYTGIYTDIGKVSEYLNTFSNLYPMGRNGLHKYNNQDHSMLTAFQAVEVMQAGGKDKHTIWELNTEDEYHEEGK